MITAISTTALCLGGLLSLLGICRHGPNDSSCSSHKDYVEPPSYREPSYSSVDSKSFEIQEFQEVGPHLVIKVKYPSCRSCSFEGVKILVLENTKATEAIFWKEMDPHFSERKKTKNASPPPAARFPATLRGWQQALKFAKDGF